MKHLGIIIYRVYLAYRMILACLLLMPCAAFPQIDTAKKLKQVDIKAIPTPFIKTLAPAQEVSSKEFLRYSAFNVADAIRNFAGVSVKDYGGIGGLKTVSVRGLGANHTAVLYDGVQLSDAQSGQVDLSKLNLNNIQQITLYNGQPPDIGMPARSFASAGVLSITTTRPVLDKNKPYLVTAGLKSGSFGLINPYFQWQQRINSRWSFVFNGFTENANGRYRFHNSGNGTDSVRTRTNADIAARQIDGALYWAKTDSNQFNLHINYYHSDRGLPGAVILYTTRTSQDRLYNQDLFIQGGYRHIWKNGVRLLLNSKFSQNYLRYINPLFQNEQNRLDQQFTQREYYQSATLVYQLTRNWQVSYAADLAINNLNIFFNYPYPLFPYPTRFNILNVLATNLTLGKLQLQSSLLNTNISETVKTGRSAPQRNVFTPTLIAVFQPFKTDNLKLRGFYKYTFRNPTFDDLYYGGIGNPNLKPEYTHQYDAGAIYNKALDGVFSYITLTADAYYNRVTNKIIFLPKDAYNGSIQNFGKVDIKGLDLAFKTRAKASPAYPVNLSVNYGYLQAINVTDPTSSIYLNQLPYTPRHTLSLNAGVDHGDFGLYYNQLISSSRYYTNDNLPSDLIPGYSISDVSLNYHKLLKNNLLRASLEVNNLFDKGYFIIQSYPMPGRSLRFSIQITI